MPSNSCATCIYFDYEVRNERVGSCRRYPPTVMLNHEGDPKPFLPRVLADDWCGEFMAFVKVDEGPQ